MPIFRAFAQSKVCFWSWTPFLQTPQAGAQYAKVPHPRATLPKILHRVSATWVLFAPSVEMFKLS